MKTVLAKGKERTLLNGNAIIESEDFEIYASYIELYGQDFTYVYCERDVFVINKNNGIEITCEKLFLDRNVNMIRIQGNALMVDKKNEIVIKGNFIENWEDENLTVIQIGVRILKEDMVCRAESARYFRDSERLELSGMPLVVWKGDEYEALKINIDLNNDEIKMEGSVKGEILWEEPDDTQDSTEETQNLPATGEIDVLGGDSAGSDGDADNK